MKSTAILLSLALTAGSIAAAQSAHPVVLPKIERPKPKRKHHRLNRYLILGLAGLADFVFTRITIGGGMADEANPLVGNSAVAQAAATVLGTVAATEFAIYLDKESPTAGKLFVGWTVGAKLAACREHILVIRRVRRNRERQRQEALKKSLTMSINVVH
jgi:hypothetical protein